MLHLHRSPVGVVADFPWKRSGLSGLAAVWFVVGFATLQYNETAWTIWLSALLMWGAALSTAALVAAPWSRAAYRTSGAFTVTAVGSRVVFTPVWSDLVEQWWVTLVVGCMYGVLLALLWWFWKVEVFPWHRRTRWVVATARAARVAGPLRG
jgi:hypothetical protein